MDRSWKRILPQEESDSSSSDEVHKRLRNVFKHYLKSKRIKNSVHDGQGTSSSQDFPHNILYPNPSDVLMHHDYVGSSKFGISGNSTYHDNLSPNQIKDLESFPDMSYNWLNNFYRGRHSVFGGNITPIGNMSPRCNDDSRPNSSQHVASSDLILRLSPQPNESEIQTQDDDHDETPVESVNVETPSQCSEIVEPAPLPTDLIKLDDLPRETVLKSPPGLAETQDDTSEKLLICNPPKPSNQANSSIDVSANTSTAVANNDQATSQNIDQDSKLPASNLKPTSKEDRDQSLNEVLLGLLECPVCWEVMPPPIYQCLRGHLLCKPCKKRLTTCPTCRANFGINRNLAMEKVAEKLKYPCKNSGSGCIELVLLREKREHEANCPHRLYSCLSPFCAPRWTCKLNNLPHHYETMHSQMLLRGPTHVLKITHDFYRKPASLDWIILAFEQLFRVNINLVPPGEVYGCVQYIGPHNASRKYIYKLKTYLPLEIYRCIQFERTTHSDVSKIDRNYIKKDSFYLPDSWTKNFKCDHEISRSVSRLEIYVTVTPV